MAGSNCRRRLRTDTDLLAARLTPACISDTNPEQLHRRSPKSSKLNIERFWIKGHETSPFPSTHSVFRREGSIGTVPKYSPELTFRWVNQGLCSRLRLWKGALENGDLDLLSKVQHEFAYSTLKCLINISNTLIEEYGQQHTLYIHKYLYSSLTSS